MALIILMRLIKVDLILDEILNLFVDYCNQKIDNIYKKKIKLN